MSKKSFRPSGLFLAEILISILLFAVSAAVCVQLFVQSQKLTTDANEAEKACELCASMAELMDSAGSAEEFCALLKDTFGVSAECGKQIRLGYNADNELTDPKAAEHILIMDLSEEGDIVKLKMNFVRTKDEETVYSLMAEHHYPLEVTDAQRQ